MKRTIFLSLIFFLSLISESKADEPISLSLDEAIGIALRENRDILLKSEELNKAKEKLNEANAALLPSLTATSSWTDTRGYYSKDISSISNQITLKQYLFKSGKTMNTINQSKYKIGVSEAVLNKTILETVLEVKKAFYTLLLAKEYANLNKAILKNTQDHLKVVQIRYNNGEASESDVLKIKDSEANVSKTFEESLNQVETAKVLLRKRLYLDKDVNIEPKGEFVYEPIEVAFDEVSLMALKSRPEIKQYEAQEKADKLAVEIAKADNRPSIYTSWDYYSRSTTSLTFSPTKGWQDYNIVGVTFSWPVFDGFTTKAKIKQAIIDLKETKLLKEKTIIDITSELKNAYLDLKNAISKLKANEQEVDLYKDSLKVIQDKYKVGIASSLDLDDAHMALEIAQFNQKETIYDYLTARARLDKAIGGF